MINLNKLNADMDAATGQTYAKGGKKEYSFPRVWMKVLGEKKFRGRILPSHPVKNPDGIAIVPVINLPDPTFKGGKTFGDPSSGHDVTTKTNFFKELVKIHYSKVKPQDTATPEMIDLIKGLRVKTNKFIPMILYVKDVNRNEKGYIESMTPGDTPFGVVLEISSQGLWDQIEAELKEYLNPENPNQAPKDLTCPSTGYDFTLRRVGEGTKAVSTFQFIPKDRPLTDEDKALFEGDSYPNILEMLKYQWRPANELIQRVRDGFGEDYLSRGVDLSGNSPEWVGGDSQGDPFELD